jgi:ABC-type glycerol-3-phosphate transport system substrate-binding protein
MWRSVATGVLFTVALAGCGVGGGGAASHPQGAGYLGATYGITTTGTSSTTTTEDIPADRKAIKQEVANWLSLHPGGHCKVETLDSADCTAANGLPTMIVVGSDTEVVTTP